MNKEREVPVRIIVRSKRQAHSAHGGAWKVAFADFMTAMFALFLVLWLVNQSSDVKSAIAGYFADPLGRANEHGSSIMPGEGAQAASVRPLSPPDIVDLRRDRLRHMAERLQERLAKTPELSSVRNYIEIELTEDGLRIQLLEDSTGVFFQTGSAVPSERGRRILSLLGQELGALPNAVRVEGHTDARPYRGGGPYTNWELSADRANAARRILGVSGLRPNQVTQIRGYADRDLRDPADPYSPRNRRVTITMMLTETVRSVEPAVPPPDGVPVAQR
jgi:chemotaxis protein MotB